MWLRIATDPVLAPAIKRTGALNAGQIRRATAGSRRDAHLHLGDPVDQI